jgi:hypothetical protein
MAMMIYQTYIYRFEILDAFLIKHPPMLSFNYSQKSNHFPKLMLLKLYVVRAINLCVAFVHIHLYGIGQTAVSTFQSLSKFSAAF